MNCDLHPAIGFLGSAWQGTTAFIDTHPWKFSYLVATVFLAIGAVGWLTMARVVRGDLARWLPVAAGRALENVAAPGLLAPWAGGLVLAAYAFGFAAFAVAATVRRDVTKTCHGAP